MESYKTIKTNGQSEDIIKKSRFICDIFRIQSEEEGKELLSSIKKAHAKANHSCSAMIIGEQSQIKRSSDDGEPSGTAGIPILSVLEKQELTQILVVVTRYFGGIKLGTGGLIRAYSSVAANAIKKLQIVEVKEQVGIQVTLTYSQYQSFPNFLQEHDLSEHETSFSEHISTNLYCDPDKKNELIEHLVNFYQGKITYSDLPSIIIEVPL